MCESKDVRRAWPLLKRMLADSGYRDAIDETVNILNAEEKQAAVNALHEPATVADNAIQARA